MLSVSHTRPNNFCQPYPSVFLRAAILPLALLGGDFRGYGFPSASRATFESISTRVIV